MCGQNPTLAQAWSDDLNFNGFFSADFSIADDDINVIGNGGETRLLEKSELNLKNSLVGGQLQYRVTDNLSVFVQGVGYFDREENLDLSADWAYISYDLGDDYTVRGGKFQIPFLQGTELRKVGITRTWARPLIPGNGASGFEDFWGVELLKSYSAGDWHWRFQASVGKPEHGLSEVGGEFMHLASASVQYRDFTLRTALMRMEYDFTAPSGQRVADSAHSTLGSVEAEWIIDDVILNAGYSDSDAEITPNDRMWYGSVGYQIGALRPYFFGVVREQVFERPPPPPGRGMGPPPRAPLIPPPEGESRTESVGVGVRWDASERMAIKVQWQNDDIRDATRANRGRVEREGNIFSLVVEGLF